MAEAQFSSGHDVVITQYVGRFEFVEQLAGLAHRCGADFVEVVLVTEPSVAIGRFRGRRAGHEVAGTAHPEAEVTDADIVGVVHEAFDRLADICQRRPTTRRLPANGDIEETHAALLEVIRSQAC